MTLRHLRHAEGLEIQHVVISNDGERLVVTTYLAALLLEIMDVAAEGAAFKDTKRPVRANEMLGPRPAGTAGA